MEYVSYAVLVLVGLFLIDRFGLWMEGKGWLYYRHKKPSGGIGNALQEFNALLNPSARQVIEVKQKVSKREDDQGDIDQP